MPVIFHFDISYHDCLERIIVVKWQPHYRAYFLLGKKWDNIKIVRIVVIDFRGGKSKPVSLEKSLNPPAPVILKGIPGIVKKLLRPVVTAFYQNQTVDIKVVHKGIDRRRNKLVLGLSANLNHLLPRRQEIHALLLFLVFLKHRCVSQRFVNLLL